ncbi:putative membrane protein YphA (DoxX/SURF4 family) [Nocardia tenerifensis]|uniref:Putative membrane protein YphA (DoxX/SURF4 family) n=1 Tax=Nocardia tenerifensis TaxID=228006 RepID=A0A318JZM0_9NOCA|nr:DoxX family protein [Nocardia tenerifensis]PXX62506.1 putative membrane protein YphA (DoxX/SURF4 family) [Nocardia tenerifensis]
MDVVVLIGRVLFSVLFLSSALGHFTQTEAMAGYSASKGVPMAKLAVLGSGALFGLGGLSVLLGVWADLGSLVIAVVLLVTAVMMHSFWKETDAQAKQGEMIHFNKNLALVGATLMLFAFFAHVDELGLTITGPLFDL